MIRKLLTTHALIVTMLLGLLPTFSIAAWADDVTEWTSTNSLPEQGNYKLMNDVTLPTGNSVVVTIRSGQSLTIDLNGKTINAPKDRVNIQNTLFKLEGGSLTIKDSKGGGVITRPDWTDDAIVWNTKDGNFYMEGGSITGIETKADIVACYDESTFTMTGGSIVGNTLADRTDNYAVKITSGTFRISGNSTITNNNGAVDLSKRNVYLSNDMPIAVIGELLNSTPIGVTMQTPGVFTNSENVTLNDASKFLSDDENYFVKKNADGQLTLIDQPVASVTAEGTTIEYETLAEALEKWVDESTLTLLKDVETASTIEVLNGDYTLDLNGHEIKMTGEDRVISVGKDASLTLNDVDENTGKITGGNKDRGAGVYVDNGTFVINGGTITGNTASVHGGAIYVICGILDMNGGKITGNTAGKYGGGVCVAGGGSVFTLNDGTISGNTASSDGGGVYVDDTFIMNGGNITDNITNGTGNGGAVAVGNGIFKMLDGTIERNTAENGGGVAVKDRTTFEMLGGKIQYNESRIYTGGVLLETYANFTMSGGAIQNNVGPEFGGIGSAKAIVKFSGTPVVKNNTLKDGTPCDVRNTSNAAGMIEIVDKLESGAQIGVYHYMDDKAITAGYDKYNADDEATAFFFSNDESMSIKKNSNGELVFDLPPVASVTAEGTTIEYTTLAEALEAWVDGSTLTLLKDVTTTSTIEVPSGTYTLNLNGRGILMTKSVPVIRVPDGATLTIDDRNTIDHYITLSDYRAVSVSKSGTETTPINGTGVVKVTSGYIAGGISSDYGGGILVEEGSLYMTGGTVIGNRCKDAGAGISNVAGTTSLSGNTQVIYNKSTIWGGAIFNGHDDATLSISDNVIVMYNCGKSGIHLCSNPLKLSGSPKILDNTVLSGGTGKGIRAENMLDIVGPLNDAKISVCLNNVGDGAISREGQLTLPSEYIDANTAAQFVCENDGESGFTIVRKGQELWVTTGYSVSYLANGGEGTTLDENNPYVKNATATILANSFTAPEGKQFAGWNTEADGSGTAYAAGDSYEVVANLLLYAQWKPVLTVASNNEEWGKVALISPTSIFLTNGTETTFFSNENYPSLIDGDIYTKWCVSATFPVYIEFNTLKAIQVDGYKLITGNDNTSYTGRNPKDWVLKAKLNVDDEWTTIATVTNDATMQDVNYKPYEFAVDDPGLYKYFRFEVHANHGNGAFQLSELQLLSSSSLDVFVDNGDGTYFVAPGFEVIVKATPAKGCYLKEWNADVTDNNDGTFTLTMPESCLDLKAIFAPYPTITVASNNEEWGSVEVNTAGVIDNQDGTYTVNPGTEVTIKATPAKGCYLKEWNADVTDNNDGTFTLTMPESCLDLKAIFAPYPTITVASNNEEWGSVEVNTAGITANEDGTYTVNPGTEVTIKATPAEGFHLASWSNGAEVNEDGTQKIKVTEDINIVANFSSPFAIAMDTDHKAEAANSEVQNGFEINTYGYCNGNNYSLKYYLLSGEPDQYKVEFDDNRFFDIDWTELATVGPEGTIDLDIPADIPTGDYSMKVTFRNSNYTAFDSEPIEVSFHVNLPETYTVPLYDNVIALVNTCECFTDVQWYHRDNSNADWQAISDATGYYYRQVGGLTGEYFVSAKMNGVSTYTCPQTDVKTLYGAPKKVAKVHVSPNPIENNATVSIEDSENIEHDLRIVNIMGNVIEVRTFNGNTTSIDMGAYPTGSYMINVDGIGVKVIRK